MRNIHNIKKYKKLNITEYCRKVSPHGATTPSGPGPHHYRGFTINFG